MKISTATLLCSLLAVPLAAVSGSSDVVAWSEWQKDGADVRKGVFAVTDSSCAYATMANPVVMEKVIPHLEGVVVHRSDANFQDVTLTERFFPVGLSESRYHRTIDGVGRLEWKLIEGRQKKHDGFWQVEPSGRVTFQNALAPKSTLHRLLLRGIQVRAMEDVAEAVQEYCAKQ